MPKISLLSILLFVTILAMSLKLWLTSHELSQANLQLEKLRDEVGHLEGSNPAKLQIVQIPTYEDYRWRWRIRVPDGKDARLIAARGDIPADGFNIKLSTSENMLVGNAKLREFVLDIEIWELSSRKDSGVSISYNFSTVSTLKQAAPLPATFGSGKWEQSIAGSSGTQEFDLDDRVELLRLRHNSGDDELAEGFLFWLSDWQAQDSARKAAKQER